MQATVMIFSDDLTVEMQKKAESQTAVEAYISSFTISTSAVVSTTRGV